MKKHSNSLKHTSANLLYWSNQLKENRYTYTSQYHLQCVVTGVLVREEQSEQNPIFYVRKTLVDAKTRYPTMEKLALVVVVSARKLRLYLQSHVIVVMTSHPPRTILHSPSQSGRLAK